jgi:hypothetical protein
MEGGEMAIIDQAGMVTAEMTAQQFRPRRSLHGPCAACGCSEHEEDARFCKACGTPLSI